ncbi:DDB1- and CUL4-associated factor 8-like [Anopheles moucheti]|uniref:DDB1- and CUL4-associated factor 8-like n=1 Tax=Anopheles moucheti TaxID=186751 RepID=UPI0022F0ABE8|nr:DDB1- and CUL4-associated factor 8-like [Anopheles moucheti]
MDEDSPKNNANDADESSPRKKTKTEDQQQPSISPASGASTSSGIIASTSAVPIENNPSVSANERPNESVDDPPQQPVDVEDALLLEAANSASQRARSDSGEQSDDESEEARADDAFIQNLERSVERLRRNVRRLTNRNDRARDGADENAPENEPVVEEAAVIDPIESLRSNRIRNRIVNDIAQLFVPNVFRGYESNEDSIDSIDVAQVDEEFQVGIGDEEETNRELEIDADGSESDSSSNTSSSSTLTSTSESSFSYGHSSDSAYDYVHLPPRDDAEIPDCLKISSVKCQWNVVREIYQRQHGVRFHKTPTTVGKYDPSQFQKRAYGSVNLVKRLGLLHKLQHHRGCVNCLNFHPSGKLLASGSDDLRIILWNWESKKLIKSLRSGHKSNVFQTKFMVCEEYRDSELEIISTGRDGAVRHMIVDPSGHPTTKQIFRSSKPVHKVAIPARNDRVFLTAGEDETVRLCDLRQAKVQTLVNVHKRLYSIATHPFDSEFCVAGTGNAVRVYDLRRAQHPKKVLVVGEPAEQRLMSSITCAVYNHDGTEILASYNDGDIHLFKLDLPDLQMGITIKFRGHSNLRTIKGVNFFGPHSEFVASGSDCGSIYLWEKSSQTIVNWLRCSSSEVVNCLEPHPEFPILASSGVDNDIKIWVPKGLHDEQTATPFNSQDLKRYVLRNLCQRDRYDYGLPSGHIAHLFPNLSHGGRSSLRDFPDDDDRVGLSRFDCSPS